MVDIKGQQVNIGDRVLVSSKYLGLVLTTFSKESKTHYYFGNDAERLAKFEKAGYVGAETLNLKGEIWNYKRDGNLSYHPSNFTMRNKGDNGSRYKLKDMSNEKQSRILKVDDNFSL